MNIQQQLEQILIEVDKISADAYNAKVQMEVAKRKRKSLIPVLATQYEGSESMRDRLARSHKDYLAQVAECQKAELDFGVKWAKWEALQIKLSACQTLNKLMKTDYDTGSFK